MTELAGVLELPKGLSVVGSVHGLFGYDRRVDGQDAELHAFDFESSLRFMEKNKTPWGLAHGILLRMKNRGS